MKEVRTYTNIMLKIILEIIFKLFNYKSKLKNLLPYSKNLFQNAIKEKYIRIKNQANEHCPAERRLYIRYNVLVPTKHVQVSISCNNKFKSI